MNHKTGAWNTTTEVQDTDRVTNVRTIRTVLLVPWTFVVKSNRCSQPCAWSEQTTQKIQETNNSFTSHDKWQGVFKQLFLRDRKLGSNFLLDTVMALVLFLEKNKMGRKTFLFTLQAANKTKFETFEQKSSTLDPGFRWWFPWVFTGACLELVCWYSTERNFEFHETQQKSHHFSKFDTNSSSNNGETPRNTLRIFNPNRTESSVFRN